MADRRIVIFGWADSVHVRRWVNGLAGRGYRIRLISLGGNSLQNADTLIFSRRGKHSYPIHMRKAVRAARAFEPDLVHAHYAAGFGLWTLGLRFSPTVVSVWGSDITDFPRNVLTRSLIRRVLKRATYITETSQLLKIVSLHLCRECADKISVIPFGVEPPSTILPAPASPPIRLCFIKSHRLIYGPDVLLQALALAKQSVPEIELTMAGQGELTDKLKKMCAELGLDGNVRFVGHVPNEEIYALLQQHHIMVMPSLSESFGVAALEAAACTRPVIASNIGGVPEVVSDGETGILVPPKDPVQLAEAIVKLADDEAARQRMGEAGRRLVETKYRWEQSVDAMCDLYERLIHESRQKT
ncbi:MAG: glycosyltransferase [Candidatus Zixiibacteriota bacterium]